jgi:hypothetical protein
MIVPEHIKAQLKNEGAVMLNGKQIKIIKHGERSDSPAIGPDSRPTNVRRDREKAKRDAVSVVTEWVSELRRKKSEEATTGFDRLFGNAT